MWAKLDEFNSALSAETLQRLRGEAKYGAYIALGEKGAGHRATLVMARILASARAVSDVST